MSTLTPPPTPSQTYKNEYLYFRTSVLAMGNKIKSDEQTDTPTNWFQTRVKAPQQFFFFTRRHNPLTEC